MASKELTLSVSVRDGIGKSAVKKLRAAGQIPAVVYGHDADTVSLQAPAADLTPLLDAPHVIKLEFPDSAMSRHAVVSEVQRHFMSGDVLHVDFHEVHMGEEMTATVPIASDGHPAGEAEGGILEHQLHEVEIACLPSNLPEEILVDVSGLGVDDKITLADLKLPEGVRVTQEDDLDSVVVFQVSLPHLEEEAEEGDEAAEPEVISKGKQEDESDAE